MATQKYSSMFVHFIALISLRFTYKVPDSFSKVFFLIFLLNPAVVWIHYYLWIRIASYQWLENNLQWLGFSWDGCTQGLCLNSYTIFVLFGKYVPLHIKWKWMQDKLLIFYVIFTAHIIHILSSINSEKKQFSFHFFIWYKCIWLEIICWNYSW